VGVIPIQNWGTKAQKKEKRIQTRGEDAEQVDKLTHKKGRCIAINSTAALVNRNVPVS
jgi:hypothetical protein